MSTSLESHADAIRSLCRKYRVERLDVFGSAVDHASLDDCNDVDLLVTFRPMSVADRAEAYFGLWKELEALLGKPVDLVEPKVVVNPYLRYAIHQTRQTLYAA